MVISDGRIDAASRQTGGSSYVPLAGDLVCHTRNGYITCSDIAAVIRPSYFAAHAGIVV